MFSQQVVAKRLRQRTFAPLYQQRLRQQTFFNIYTVFFSDCAYLKYRIINPNALRVLIDFMMEQLVCVVVVVFVVFPLFSFLSTLYSLFRLV